MIFTCVVGWGVDQGVGGFGDEPGIKVQMMTLIRSVRTVMRGERKPHLAQKPCSRLNVNKSNDTCFSSHRSAFDCSEFRVYRFVAAVWMKKMIGQSRRNQFLPSSQTQEAVDLQNI